MTSHSATVLGPRARTFAAAATGWVDRLGPAARSVWAKTSKTGEGDLRLPQHMVDSACVGVALWEGWVSDSLQAYLCSRLGVTAGEVQGLVAFMCGVHDAGKASISFLIKVEKRAEYSYLIDDAVAAGLPVVGERELPNFTLYHPMASQGIIERWLCKPDRAVPERVARNLATIAGAHHGIPVSGEQCDKINRIFRRYPAQWVAVHDELLDAMEELCGVAQVLPRLTRDAVSADVQQVLTGLVIMADWIASNQDAFPLEVDPDQERRVAAGMARVDLPGPWQPRELSAEEIADPDALLRASFRWTGQRSARPVQEAAVRAAASISGQTLMIIEAPTGEGKTEAALSAAHVIAQRTGAQGVMLCLPTMATANGLFVRALEWARVNTASGEVSSLYLAHSKSTLNKDYGQLRHSNIGPDMPSEDGAVVASQWLSGRKKGLLADFVVGTIDQALMACLQQRHAMLRHLALAGKVIVLDELHAYDAYTSEYIKALLGWLARYGASVIVLSATLPPAQRRAFAQAYDRELPGHTGDCDTDATGYPLITCVTRDGVKQLPVTPRPTDAAIAIELIDDPLPELSRHVTAAVAEDGGCVLIICNTIARAQEAYRHLADLFPGEVELHHAGFMAWQRAEREDALRRALGPQAHRGGTGADERPWRRIVVATQVAEQSLDIDVDLLVTDMAPMDLLIQRMGRMHRHQRPEADRPANLRTPRTLIRGIRNYDGHTAAPDWDCGTAAIYDPAILLASLAILPETFRRPDDIEDLVRRAYSEHPDIPEAWREAWQEAEVASRVAKEQARARAATFRMPGPREGETLAELYAMMQKDHNAEQEERRGQAQVRDIEPAVEVIPIMDTPTGYQPLGWPGGELDIADDAQLSDSVAFHLATSTVRLPLRVTKRNFEEVITLLEQATPVGWRQDPKLRGQVALRLDDEYRITLGKTPLRYTDDVGLEIESNTP